MLDGPFTESKEFVGGYMVVQVRTLDEAIDTIRHGCASIARDSECATPRSRFADYREPECQIVSRTEPTMYLPESFRESARSVAFDLIDEYGFATLVSWSGPEPLVSHVPLILDRAVSGQERVLGHVALANPHWRRFAGKEPALAIFLGPHGYVSPFWYANHPSVPTWNYAVVHVHGTPELVDSQQTVLPEPARVAHRRSYVSISGGSGTRETALRDT